ncbi:ISLre2 family transposase [Halothermothrix orenii]|nr:ISLre2 family transposase [Halothermothrix orenii]
MLHVQETVSKLALIIMEKFIKELEEELFRTKPKDLEVVGFRKKNIATKLGEIKIKRRLYKKKNSKNDYIFLLDDKLNIRKGRRVSGEYLKLLVSLSSMLSFRQVEEVIEEAGFPSLSHATIHKEVREFGERESKRIEYEREKVFTEGKLQVGGKKEKDLLFIEADGIMVSSQEDKERMEIKVGVVHEGWNYETPAKSRRRLKNPKVVMGMYKDADSFWEEFSSEISKEYDLTNTQVVLNGDGASWIQETAKDYFPGLIVQLDRFHIKKDVSRHFGYEIAEGLYKVLQEGEVQAFLDTLESLIWEAKTKEKQKQQHKLVKHYQKYKEHLLDYRYRLPEKLKQKKKLYGMGVVEGYVDKNIARRMKNQGMSWSKKGAEAMAKILMLKHNKKLKERLNDEYYKIKSPIKVLKYRKRKYTGNCSNWLQAKMPVLYGVDSGKDWVKAIKQLVTV